MQIISCFTINTIYTILHGKPDETWRIRWRNALLRRNARPCSIVPILQGRIDRNVFLPWSTGKSVSR